jgi:hypothetical protein
MPKHTKLNNPKVIEELTRNGGDITDWEKRTTPSIDLSTGQRIQVHYYYNVKTGEINYNIDFKVKNPVNVFPSRPIKEPIVLPPYPR